MVIGKVLEESDRSDAAKVSFLSDAEKVTTINGSPCQERDFSKAAKASALSDAEQAEPGLHGIKNSGNVCYLISILQALAHLRAMWRNVLAFTCASPKKKLSFEYGKFQEALWSTDLRLPPDPADLAKLLGLQPKVQQDAQEALHGLLDGLMEEQGGWFQEAFQVATSSSVKCASCHHGAEEVIEPFTRIVVPVWESHTQLQDGLNQWAAPDVIQDSRCTLCGEAKSQTTRLSMLPEVLILQLARFAYCKDMGVQKKERAIQLPLALDVDPWMARGCEGARYSLASVVSHHGPVPDAGHYSSTVLVDTNWYTFNDDVVTRTEAPTHGDEAYILFYVREPAQVSLSPEKEKPRMLEYDQDACRQRAERQQRLFEEQLKVAVERQRERGEDMRMRTEENLQRWHERAAQRLLECAEDERMSREERQQRYVAALRDADAKLSRILEELLLEREEAHERYTMPQKTGEFVLKQLEEDAQRRRDSHLAIQPAMDNCLQGFNEHLAQVDEIYDACFAQFQKDVGAQPDMGRSPRSVVAAELRRDGEALGVDIGKEMRSEEVPPDKSEQETGEKAPDEPKTCEVPKRKRRKGMEEKDRDEEPPKALAKTKGASTAKAAPKALVKKAAAKKAAPKASVKKAAAKKAKTVLPRVPLHCSCGATTDTATWGRFLYSIRGEERVPEGGKCALCVNFARRMKRKGQKKVTAKMRAQQFARANGALQQAKGLLRAVEDMLLNAAANSGQDVRALLQDEG